jgi:hypothetical protein
LYIGRLACRTQIAFFTLHKRKALDVTACILRGKFNHGRERFSIAPTRVQPKMMVDRFNASECEAASC